MGSPAKRIQYRYDARGNRQSLIDPDGGRFTYAYDARNRIQSVQNPQGERTTYSYDVRNRRTVMELANGTRTSYVYDAVSNLRRLSNLKSDGSVISDFQYRYDKTGNRTSVVEADGSRVTWSYDAASQLTGEFRTGPTAYRNTFAYDPAGNRTLKNEGGVRTTYSYDVANQLQWSQDASGRTTYTFDADGNQQRVLAPDGSRTTTVWDYENRATSVQLPSGIRNTMAYDPQGLRVKLEESTGTKKFIWDDQNYMAETDGSNDTQVVYTNEPQYYGNLISQRRLTGGIWVPSWYHFDALGSARQLTDTTQAVTDQRLYDAWGTVLQSSGSTVFPFQHVGRFGYYSQYDHDAIYVRARIYHPLLARWRSVEPRHRQNHHSLYGYCASRPLFYIDPSGLIEVKVTISEPFEFTAEAAGGCDSCYDYAWQITFRLKVVLAAGESFKQFRDKNVQIFGRSYSVRYGVLIQFLSIERDDVKCEGESKVETVLQREWFERNPDRFPEVDSPPQGVGLEPTAPYDIADDHHSALHKNVRFAREKREMVLYTGDAVNTDGSEENRYWNLFEPMPFDPADFEVNSGGSPQGFWLRNFDSRHDWGYTVICDGKTCTLSNMYGVS